MLPPGKKKSLNAARFEEALRKIAVKRQVTFTEMVLAMAAGRKEVEDLAECFAANRAAVVVVGPPACGKSTLVRNAGRMSRCGNIENVTMALMDASSFIGQHVFLNDGSQKTYFRDGLFTKVFLK